MTDQERQSAPAPTPAAPTFSATRLLVASCAVAATAAYLGAAWLRTPVFGLPAGLWLIAITQGAAAAWDRRNRRRAHPTTPPASASAPDLASFDVALAAGRIAAAAVEAGHAIAGAMQVPPERVLQLEQSLKNRLDRLAGPAQPLRIGIDAAPDLARALVAAAGPLPGVQWVPLHPGTDDAPDLRRHRLDALVRHHHQAPLRIVTPEHADQDAAWYDWSTPRPLTYASLFPARLDPARITLDDIDPADSAEIGLVAALACAAAALSRIPVRLTLADRLRGRRPEPAARPGAPGTAEACLRDISAMLIASSGTLTPARRSAARVLSAWLSGTDSWPDMATRRAGAEAALQALPDEPEVLLRAAAVRFAACDDRAALDILLRADQLIREQRPEAAVDHLLFLEAEVELGLPGPMTLGRVAAGIALVCATSPASRLDYIRTDVMDDARYSAWLVGRDQDRAVLAGVFRMLGASRRPRVHDDIRRAA